MSLLEIFEKQWKLIVAVLLSVVVAGAAITIKNVSQTEKEKRAQESYFLTEKKFFDYKNKKTAPAEQAAQIPEVDPAQLKADFEKILNENPGTVAAQMSALHYSSLLAEEKNFEAALAVLQKNEDRSKGLVNTLLQQQIGQLLAHKNDCQTAIQTWQKIVDRKEASFLHGEVKIQQALCYTQLNDLQKAEELLTNLANQSANPEIGDSSTSKEAEKYLRLLQFRKASGTSVQ